MRLCKKIIVIGFAFLLMLALTACKNDSADSTRGDSTLGQSTSAESNIVDTK